MIGEIDRGPAARSQLQKARRRDLIDIRPEATTAALTNVRSRHKLTLRPVALFATGSQGSLGRF